MVTLMGVVCSPHRASASSRVVTSAPNTNNHDGSGYESAHRVHVLGFRLVGTGVLLGFEGEPVGGEYAPLPLVVVVGIRLIEGEV